ncbi:MULTISPECIES: tRNA pseudouridine(13) synthase TruD [unclassified Thioalkalivibrio]|uniref:tRNA pseudouridine(13) synthase TruD n=1 Tax=unclassified Thioalkalivibrio TaxID=2621013 RepID=UPI0003A57EB8|nr:MULTISPECIES: tRNA pseudouridine(13) synthase TruD [unclassified Thioalkalivibrio]
MTPVYPWSPPITGRMKEAPEDFCVFELPATEPEGSGEHLWLEIEKRLLNTEDVAVALARACGVPRGQVSYAGRKDRQAVTRQWFSVQCTAAAEPDWQDPATLIQRMGKDAVGEARVLRAERHSRKLRTGHLAGNRFVVWLRDVAGDRDMAGQILRRIREEGVPNYFGQQRFGRRNLEQAEQWLSGGRAPRGRNQRSLLLSAARSAIFNAVLAERVADDSWARFLPGDVATFQGSGSVFAVPEVTADIEQRLAEGVIHPTGPLWGRGEPLTAGDVRAREAECAGRFESLASGLEAQGVKSARRALRMLPGSLGFEWQGNDLRLELELGPGEYATSVIDALMDSAPKADTP